MKVKSETSTELVVTESTAWLSYFFLLVAVALFYGVGLHGREHTWKAFIPAAVFLVFAAAFDLRTEVTFDNVRRQAHWTRRRLFWVKSRTIAFDDIKGVVMESSVAKNNQFVYRLTILTSEGSVPMSDTYSGDKQSHADLRTKILFFLNMPVEDSEDALNEQTIRSLLAQGRKIDAIQLLCSAKHVGLTAAKQQVEAIEARIESK